MSLQQSPRCARALCWWGICHCILCEFHRAAYLLASMLGTANRIPLQVTRWEETLTAEHTIRLKEGRTP